MGETFAYSEELLCHKHLYAPLSRIMMESASNAIRHGGVTRLTVDFEFTRDCCSLNIADNGKGAAGMQKGNGLTGMEERVYNLFGEISFSSGDQGGFRISIYLPVIVEDGEEWEKLQY